MTLLGVRPIDPVDSPTLELIDIGCRQNYTCQPIFNQKDIKT